MTGLFNIFNNLWIGEVGVNPYTDINTALDWLGLGSKAGPLEPHSHHFHIMLKPPAVVPITPSPNLLSDGSANNADSVLTIPNMTEDFDMLLDVVAEAPVDNPIVLVAQQIAPKQKVYVASETAVGLESSIYGNFIIHAGAFIYKNLAPNEKITSFRVVKAANNLGKLTWSADGEFEFFATKLGKGYILYEVTSNFGRKFFIKLPIEVIPLEVNISEQSINIAKVLFKDLDGNAIGQHDSQQITLDTNAAGHGWFTNPQEDWLSALTTAQDTHLWLPTSNANEWIARSGSEADGKMDMLSVLWHEMGHAFSLER